MEHDIFSEEDEDEEEEEPFDYGCCGDNLPMPEFDQHGEAI